MRTVVFYISGHGFGHASRDIEVINALLARSADVRVIARTTAPQWLFDKTVTPRNDAGDAARFRRVEVETDTGVVQIDSLHLDAEHTIRRARDFMGTFQERVKAEAAFLRQYGAELVVSDIPALGIAAARNAGVPGVGLGNFTWDWIYAGYEDSDDVVALIAEEYSAAHCALRLPMHGGFSSFRHVVDLPFVARRSSRDVGETRRLLQLPTNERIVLLSFGGYGLDRIDQHALQALDDYHVVGSHHHPLDESAMYDAGLRYEDLVRAVDVVVTKPGYGIISECIANKTALLYTSRGHFVEYDVLVREMPRYLRSAFISHGDLFAGNWRESLDHLLDQPDPPEAANVDGARVAADALLSMIEAV